MRAVIIKPIIEQHAEEAAFLWLLRNAAVHEPHYSIRSPCLAQQEGLKSVTPGFLLAGLNRSDRAGIKGKN